MAVETSFTFPFSRTQTPIIFFLEAQMHRCDLGGRPDLLPENEDGGQDIELENICNASKCEVRRYHLGSGSTKGRRSPSTSPVAAKKKKNRNTLKKKPWPTKVRRGQKDGR